MPAPTLLSRALAASERSSYLASIGFAVEHAAEGASRARLRRNDLNANRAGVLHGGAIASVVLGAAELAAASTERERHEADLRASTLAVSFLDAARAEDELTASAEVLRRGRDVVHVRAEARSEQGALVAAALLAYRVSDEGAAAEPRVAARAAPAAESRAGRLAGSPYMGARRAEMLVARGGEAPDWSCMSLPLEGNEGGAGRIHDGAVAGLVDTCAALASFLALRDREAVASTTVALSIAWAAELRGDARAGARLTGRAGAVCTSEAEVWSAADGMLCASAVVCYRMRFAGG